MRIIYKLTFILLFFFSSAAQAQHLFKGRVIDKLTRQPIPYAGISITNASITTITDRYGNFEIKSPVDSACIQISCIGYSKQYTCLKLTAKRVDIILDHGSLDLKDVVISPHHNNNSFHTMSGLDLNLRPANSSQDLLRLVPGLFIAQHMGGGKAEQIFLRGFDADHGTDVNISVDGMPVNMVSHAHAQGYADMHFLIPETVSSFDFGKGPYYTDRGDFTTAGYISYATKDVLNQSTIKLEAGQFNTHRAMAMIDLLSGQAKQKGESAYIAGEYNYTDGPFSLKEHYKRINLFGKYNTMIGSANKLSFSASTFSTSWKASGEIPVRAIADKQVDRFGTVDSLQGGNSSRSNASVKLISDLGNNLVLENQAYFSHYKFNLRVNSTFFAGDDVNGDAKRQQDARDLYGYNSKLTKRSQVGTGILTFNAGAGLRIDRTYNSGQFHIDRNNNVLDTIALGDIRENNINGYIDESLETGKWLFNAGSRIDYFAFNYHNQVSAQLPSRGEVIVSPKINIQYTFDQAFQLYLKTGKGFHSNDARVVVLNKGIETLPAAYGTDFGMNWKPLPHLYINAALWYLYLQQEFVYTDDGGVAPAGKTQRIGMDVSARYQLTHWLFADLNINLAKPRLLDSLKGKNYIPLAPTLTSTGGLDFRFDNGINGGISYRYMRKRPGNNDYSLVANGYYVTDLTLNYTKRRYEIGLAIENLFNTKWDEFSVEEVSRLRNEPAPVDGMSITPGTPFFAKLKFALFF